MTGAAGFIALGVVIVFALFIGRFIAFWIGEPDSDEQAQKDVDALIKNHADEYYMRRRVRVGEFKELK